MNKKPKLLTASQVEQLFDILSEHISPRCELEHRSVLDLLIAVVLSAQTTDKQVNVVTADLWKKCKTCQDYIDLGENGVAKAIKRIGLYRNKAKSVIGICQKLLSDFNGEVPKTREELMTLPGVGRKTANVVMNVGYGMPTLAVDTHVFRVANRTGLVSETTVEGVEQALLKRVPQKHLLNAHHYLLLHGRYTCKARSPECDCCPIATICRKIIEK